LKGTTKRRGYPSKGGLIFLHKNDISILGISSKL
jgi:hypothetical protein